MPHVETTRFERGKAGSWRTGSWVILQHRGCLGVELAPGLRWLRERLIRCGS